MPTEVGSRWPQRQRQPSRMDDEEKELPREALNAANGVVSQVARELGIARPILAGRFDALGFRTSRNTEG